MFEEKNWAGGWVGAPTGGGKKEYLLLGSSHKWSRVINYFKTLAILAKHSYQDYKSIF